MPMETHSKQLDDKNDKRGMHNTSPEAVCDVVLEIIAP
jgi:hypothetical protein